VIMVEEILDYLEEEDEKWVLLVWPRNNKNKSPNV
jgi:hypothetical protein